MAYSSLLRGHKASGKVLTRPGPHLRLEVIFQAHLVCLQQSVPCSSKIPSGSLLQSQTERERLPRMK